MFFLGGYCWWLSILKSISSLGFLIELCDLVSHSFVDMLWKIIVYRIFNQLHQHHQFVVMAIFFFIWVSLDGSSNNHFIDGLNFSKILVLDMIVIHSLQDQKDDPYWWLPVLSSYRSPDTSILSLLQSNVLTQVVRSCTCTSHLVDTISYCTCWVKMAGTVDWQSFTRVFCDKG